MCVTHCNPLTQFWIINDVQAQKHLMVYTQVDFTQNNRLFHKRFLAVLISLVESKMGNACRSRIMADRRLRAAVPPGALFVYPFYILLADDMSKTAPKPISLKIFHSQCKSRRNMFCSNSTPGRNFCKCRDNIAAVTAQHFIAIIIIMTVSMRTEMKVYRMWIISEQLLVNRAPELFTWRN